MNELKEKRNFRGITLIALVVTIVVLLILSGVSLNLVIGNNGIITRASQANERAKIGEEKESIAVAYNGVMIDTEGTGVSALDLQKELRNNGYNATVTDNGDATLTVTFESGREYIIDANGNISKPRESNIVATMKIEGEKVTNPPMPSSNFTHIEGTTVDSGYVIQDSEGNEFVWVPVEKDQKITLNITSKKDVKELKVYAPFGDEILTLTDEEIETTYSNTNITPTINGRYLLEVTTEDGTETKTLIVKSLYARDAYNDWNTLEEVAKLEGISKQELLQGVAINWGFESLDDMLEYFNISSIEEFEQWFLSGMKDEFKDTADYTESVNKNGGFYIARYEAGVEHVRTDGDYRDSVDDVKAESGIPVSKEGYVPYNFVSYEQAKGLAESMYSSITSNFEVSLITGSGWDRTLGWIYETGNKSIAEISENSKSWGNYKDIDFEISKGKYSEDFGKTYTPVSGTYKKNNGKSVLLTTGTTERNSANNIFDLAGNVAELTNEENKGPFDSHACNVFRGQCYYDTGTNDCASVRICGTECINNLGFRAALYIK